MSCHERVLVSNPLRRLALLSGGGGDARSSVPTLVPLVVSRGTELISLRPASVADAAPAIVAHECRSLLQHLWAELDSYRGGKHLCPGRFTGNLRHGRRPRRMFPALIPRIVSHWPAAQRTALCPHEIDVSRATSGSPLVGLRSVVAVDTKTTPTSKARAR